jgi:hypothetical protein
VVLLAGLQSADSAGFRANASFFSHPVAIAVRDDPSYPADKCIG